MQGFPSNVHDPRRSKKDVKNRQCHNEPSSNLYREKRGEREKKAGVQEDIDRLACKKRMKDAEFLRLVYPWGVYCVNAFICVHRNQGNGKGRHASVFIVFINI